MTVMERVFDHYKEARTLFSEDEIVGVFLQGSQNYGLEVEDSDVDTKCIVIPSLADIVFNKKPVSTTHVRENDEHIDLKDLRLMLQTFRKQNVNFIEILFTKYFVLNPKYESEWMRLVNKREEVAHYSWYQTVKAMRGVAMEKFHALEHPYPAKLAVLEKYGYNPKQLCHLIRVEEFIRRYLAGESYENCLRPVDTEFLKSVKLGYYTLEEARVVAQETINSVDEMYDNYPRDREDEVNEDVAKLLDDVQYNIVAAHLKKELSDT